MSREYWRNRHLRMKGDIRAVGNIGLSETDNLKDYETKALELIQDLTDIFPNRIVAIWDAGCGDGRLTQLLTEFSDFVHVSDVSPEALEITKQRTSAVDVKEDTLAEVSWSKTFDLVTCLDVLYHVIGDEEWENSIRNLARHVGPGGSLVVQEHLVEESEAPNTHIRYRTLDLYSSLLEKEGLSLVKIREYTLPRSGSVLHLMIWERS